jgi:hypothetical protein
MKKVKTPQRGASFTEAKQWVIKNTVRRFAQALRDEAFLSESAS